MLQTLGDCGAVAESAAGRLLLLLLLLLLLMLGRLHSIAIHTKSGRFQRQGCRRGLIEGSRGARV
jgi:hypothetical protein